MYQLLELFHLEHCDDLLDGYIHTLQALLLLYPYSKMYTVSTVFIHNNVGANIGVKNSISHLLC